MKANEFVKEYGIGCAIQEWLVLTEMKKGDFDQNYVNDLKHLIESHDLVEKCGGLISCKKILFARINHKPKAQYFAIHPEKPNLIQLYMRNEAKLIPNYRFRDLEKAIADVESCQ